MRISFVRRVSYSARVFRSSPCLARASRTGTREANPSRTTASKCVSTVRLYGKWNSGNVFGNASVLLLQWREFVIVRRGAYGVTLLSCFFFQAEDGIRDLTVTGVKTCALPIYADRRERAESDQEFEIFVGEGVGGGEVVHVQDAEHLLIRAHERRAHGAAHALDEDRLALEALVGGGVVGEDGDALFDGLAGDRLRDVLRRGGGAGLPLGNSGHELTRLVLE